MRIPPELRQEQRRIEEIARRCGLDFFETHFEMVEADQLNEVAAYGGFPTRYPHWRFGMEYERLARGYEWGVSKIYELVINNDPCYAYLMSSNDFVAQQLVMAHVYGHCDFFKNNYQFSVTRRNMIDVMANNATRVWRAIDHYGHEEVERFIDCCLSLENLIDPQLPFSGAPAPIEQDTKDETTRIVVERLEAKDYMDAYINPPEELERKRRKAMEAAKKTRKFPESPHRDVLLFLLYYAPLKRWQREILNIIRDEAYYFAPQARTKIMNEGWASYWHSRIMTEQVLDDSGIIQFADLHAGTMYTPPGGLNPYKLGLELYRDIEERWNTGRHGLEWEACDDLQARNSWDTGAGKGREKIFEVRRLYDDVNFISEFLTPEFCRRNKLFSFAWSEDQEQFEIASREFVDVKNQLLDSITNAGQPFIFVEDGNYLNRSELLLSHQHTGVDLDVRYVERTLANIAVIWGRPVNLITQVEGEETMYRANGEGLQTEKAA